MGKAHFNLVSIAGGDSFWGLRCYIAGTEIRLVLFQSQVAILFGGYVTIVIILIQPISFQSQVAILFGGYVGELSLEMFKVYGFNRRWRFFLGATRNTRPPLPLTDAVSIAGGDSFWGLLRSVCDEQRSVAVSIAGGDSFWGLRKL